MGLANAVTFDMGGTTAKASIIENGGVLKTTEYEVGGHMSATTRLTGGGGYPITVPAIDIAEVGAGGGSLVWIDAGGSLRVGPQSAGAAPGPVCYGAGGERPTVTDANLVLGYLNPESIAGGAIEVRPEPARAALEAGVARPLGLGLAEAAYGVHLHRQFGDDGGDPGRLDAARAGCARFSRWSRSAAAVRRTRPDSRARWASAPSSFRRARASSRRSGCWRPSSNCNARGRSMPRPGPSRKAPVLPRSWPRSRRRSRRSAAREAGAAALAYEVSADMRYWGQSFELPIAAPADLAPAELVATLVEALRGRAREHVRPPGQERTGGDRRAPPHRRAAAGAGAASGLGATGVANGAAEPEASREAWFGPGYGWTATPVVGRGSVPAHGPGRAAVDRGVRFGDRRAAGMLGRSDASGSIVITLAGPDEGGAR